MIYTIALVGRPNAGKSALFNRLIGKRKAIVTEIEGTTRDILHEPITIGKKKAILMDLAGLSVVKNEEPLHKIIQQQAKIGIEQADLVLFCVDSTSIITQDDLAIAKLIRKSELPIILVGTKADNQKREREAVELYRLGFGDPVFVSSEHGLGVDILQEKMLESLKLRDKMLKAEAKRALPSLQKELEGISTEAENPDAPKRDPLSTARKPGEAITFCMVGKPNVGKSSLFNSLTNEQRSIVSDIPGTTRDIVDTKLTRGKQDFLLVDTAGFRRPGKVGRGIEFYSVRRAEDMIKRSDVCLLVLDAMETVSNMDQAVSRYILEENKGLIIVVNKWDLGKESHSPMSSEPKSNPALISKRPAKAEKEAAALSFPLAKGKVAESRMELTTENFVRSAATGWGIPKSKKPTKLSLSKNQPVERTMMDKYLDYLQKKFEYLPWAPVMFVSAKEGENVESIFDQVVEVYNERQKRVPTGPFNRFIDKVTIKHHATGTKGIRPKIFYATQIETNPPHFVLFVNEPEAFHFSWMRYFEKELRDQFGFIGTPINIELRARKREDHRGGK